MTVLKKAFVVSSGVVGDVSNHAIIAYQQLVGDVDVTSEEPGYPGEDTLSPLTYNYWLPVSLPATYTLTLPAAVVVNYVGIAAHTLGTTRSSVSISYDDSTGTHLSGEYAPTDDRSILHVMPDVYTDKITIDISGVTPPQIGVVYVGKYLRMQRGIYQGHSPAILSRRTEYRTNVSERGQWLGRTVIRKGYRAEYSWANLRSDWYRAYFDPFVSAARDTPFFISWRPEEYPGEAIYGWTTADISPSNSGPSDLMTVSISVEGYA